MAGRGQDASALLFDNIKDYPEGHRVLVGMVESSSVPPSLPTCPPTSPATSSSPPGRNASTTPTLIPPQYVDESPLYENVFTGKDIDVLKLPVPKWHDEDGGRYIGTAHVVMTQTRTRAG